MSSTTGSLIGEVEGVSIEHSPGRTVEVLVRCEWQESRGEGDGGRRDRW